MKQCGMCSRTFDTEAALAMHYKDVHPEVPQENRKAKMQLPKQIYAVLVIAIIAIVVILAYYFLVQSTSARSTAIDGIQCDSLEGSVMHIHPHLTIISNNQSVTIPAGIGIRSSCLFGLHTHDASGKIHIESPIAKNFTLGQFIDIWNATQRYSGFGPSSLSNAQSLTAYINGSVYNGNYRNIMLSDGEQIKLVVKT